MTLWILWSIFVSGVIALAAVAIERVATFARAPRRFIWIPAIVVAFAAPLALALRPAPAIATSERAIAVTLAPTATGAAPLRNSGFTRTDAVGSPRSSSPQLVAPIEVNPVVDLRVRVEAAARRAFAYSAVLMRDADPWVARAWVIASLALLVALVRSLFALRTLRTSWSETSTEIGRVFVARDAGPAVVGFLKPRIVVPAWALALPGTNRDMLLKHEVEHVNAGDSRVLLASEFLRALVPWNAALWWMIRQLRLAIEIDCDDRVIRAGSTARAYGLLLLAVGERYATSLPLAASLSEPHVNLETRIEALTFSRPRRPILASLPFMAAAILLLTAAASSPRPRPLLPASREHPALPAIVNAPKSIPHDSAFHLPNVALRNSNPPVAPTTSSAPTRAQGVTPPAPQQFKFVDTRRIAESIPAVFRGHGYLANPDSTSRITGDFQNTDLRSLVARILLEDRIRIARSAPGSDGQLFSAVVVTEAEVASAINRASEQTTGPANEKEVRGLVARVLLEDRARIARDANGQLRSTISVSESEVIAAIDRARAQMRDTTALITVEFQQTDIREVTRIFAEFSGRTIVVEKDVVAFLTTSIKDQPWKAALSSILDRMDLDAVEDSTGVIRVRKRSECDPGTPVFVIDGVIQGKPCGHQVWQTWFMFTHKPN